MGSQKVLTVHFVYFRVPAADLYQAQRSADRKGKHAYGDQPPCSHPLRRPGCHGCTLIPNGGNGKRVRCVFATEKYLLGIILYFVEAIVRRFVRGRMRLPCFLPALADKNRGTALPCPSGAFTMRSGARRARSGRQIQNGSGRVLSAAPAHRAAFDLELEALLVLDLRKFIRIGLSAAVRIAERSHKRKAQLIIRHIPRNRLDRIRIR